MTGILRQFRIRADWPLHLNSLARVSLTYLVAMILSGASALFDPLRERKQCVVGGTVFRALQPKLRPVLWRRCLIKIAEFVGDAFEARCQARVA